MIKYIYFNNIMESSQTVVSFILPVVQKIKYTPKDGKIIIPQFEELGKCIIEAKNLYNKPSREDKKQFQQIIRLFNHSVTFRRTLSTKYNTRGVSNAWLKAYEIFDHFNLFPKEADKFVMFDNAAFPGSFILAGHHFVTTKCLIQNFDWYASSMISKDEHNTLLEDEYRLYQNYSTRWLMNEKNNGDVTQIETQREFARVLGGKVDLYTSDLGFDVSENYNNQEQIHAKANLGQIISGLLTLKEGGSMVIKQYSFLEPFTISLMAIMTKIFSRVEICKPMFSKSGNSETYLVCLNYKSLPFLSEILLDRLNNWSLNPLCTIDDENFISAIIQAQMSFSTKQIKTLNKTFAEYNRLKDKNMTTREILQVNRFAKQNNLDLKKWLSIHKLVKMPQHLKLDTINQKN